MTPVLPAQPRSFSERPAEEPGSFNGKPVVRILPTYSQKGELKAGCDFRIDSEDFVISHSLENPLVFLFTLPLQLAMIGLMIPLMMVAAMAFVFVAVAISTVITAGVATGSATEGALAASYVALGFFITLALCDATDSCERNNQHFRI